MPLNLRQENVDSKGYSVITLYKHVTKTRNPRPHVIISKKIEVWKTKKSHALKKQIDPKAIW
jgi:hypothetical protein